ncbi:maleylacetoacetate isomerase [Aquisediminimonas profunda]|uniref:maleylacetoacetate isomerase n=1 Tax=Aquisediminimonas profunda TaxID=1550733 RepID=UPI001C633059|nr:maleylacetoacetate isomerase [Aquisediminimonas profunda]
MTIRLYDYWRSSASYRVRIALNMKGLAYEAVPTSLLDGAQRAPDYVAKNPQGFVPMLEVGELRLTQSLAIIDWLDATQPGVRLIPSDPDKRAHALAMAYLIASDIHPVNNLRILKYLKNELGVEEAARDDWYRHWIIEGFTALEAMADRSTPYLGGEAPNIADICLVPQMANANRFNTPLDAFPNLVRIDAACNALNPFKAAHPEAVKP